MPEFLARHAGECRTRMVFDTWPQLRRHAGNGGVENQAGSGAREICRRHSLWTPRTQFRSALETLTWVRARLWADEAMKWAFVPEPAPCLNGKPTWYWAWRQILASAFKTLLWPLILLFIVVLALLSSVVSFAVALWSASALEAAILTAAYCLLRLKENTDVPDDSLPLKHDVAQLMKRENHTAQNHFFGVSTMKAGFLRRLTLRLGLWRAGQIAAHASRPSFLGDTGLIHFARWILLPGTNNLLFMSNYDGSWEGYLEDFIQIAFQGVNGIWSNTIGFPRTKNLFFEGAVDGNRLRP